MFFENQPFECSREEADEKIEGPEKLDSVSGAFWSIQSINIIGILFDGALKKQIKYLK